MAEKYLIGELRYGVGTPPRKSFGVSLDRSNANKLISMILDDSKAEIREIPSNSLEDEGPSPKKVEG